MNFSEKNYDMTSKFVFDFYLSKSPIIRDESRFLVLFLHKNGKNVIGRVINHGMCVDVDILYVLSRKNLLLFPK